MVFSIKIIRANTHNTDQDITTSITMITPEFKQQTTKMIPMILLRMVKWMDIWYNSMITKTILKICQQEWTHINLCKFNLLKGKRKMLKSGKMITKSKKKKIHLNLSKLLMIMIMILRICHKDWTQLI